MVIFVDQNWSIVEIQNENWEVEWVDPKELKIAPTNVRVEDISDIDKEIMDRSVATVKIKEPIIINENNEIVSGSLRWSSALRVGLEKVPVIRKKFKNKFEERITCMLQDDLHHPLTDRARYEFVKKCIEEDGKSLEEIADALGKSVHTIRQWTKYTLIPEQIKGNEELERTFLETSRKKKLELQSIALTKYFQEEPEEYVKLVEKTREENLPLSTLEEIRKTSKSNLPVDVDFVTEISKVETELVKVKVPKAIISKFKKRLFEEKRDFFKTIVDLMEAYGEWKIDL